VVELRHESIEVDREQFKIVLFMDSTPQVRLRDTRDQLRALGSFQQPRPTDRDLT
jgi:hypothetical protein